ncbi:transcription factor [Sphingomonas sediminicola]|uniref:Transcription factor n=1 Tax=Sphingomonas sediminicola TaxID=386874 RepID=A0ABX6TDD9_9SPHN|nr:transcription factor [Sphingomonas sediminicola]QNP45648.1 transcription factor [Sphingomonas sediminicola]
MRTSDILTRIRRAIEKSPRNGYVAELHVQAIKYAEELEGVTGREFCEALGIGPSFGTEFAKMRKIAPRLKAAGLDVDRL